MGIDPKAAELLSRGWYKEHLTQDDCEFLLSFRDKSSEANLAVSLANRLMHRACSDVGQICAEIQVSSGPCSKNCHFCRYAEGICYDRFEVIEDSALAKYAQLIGGFSDVKNIRLTTCGDVEIDELCEQVHIVNQNARKGTRVYVNTRDLTFQECTELKKAGAYGAYHACRIGEGKDTEIKPETRLETISNLVRAGLSVITGIEPIGPEHTNEDIVETFFKTLNMRCSSAEIYAREPVTGTDFAKFNKLGPARFAQIRAVLMLASAWCAAPKHTSYPGLYVTAQNIAYAKYDSKSGKDQIEAARRKLFNSGFDRILKSDDSTVELNLGYLMQTGSV